MMRVIAILSLVGGLMVGTALVAYFGFNDVASMFMAVGWTGFLVIVFCQLGLICLLGLSWYVVTPQPARLRALVWGRLIRDSSGELLPLSQLGGFVLGARAAMLGGVPGTAAAASTIVDVTMELFAQLAYTALGIAIFCAQQSRNTLPWQATLGLVFGLVGALGFVAIQRRGIGVAERAIARIAKPWVHGLAGLPRLVHAQMQAIYMRPGALWLAAALHFCAWVASSLQAWIALRFMGVDIGPASVLAIESLLYAVRSVAFAVPSAFGVQEGAYLVLGTLFGLTPEAALALSLLKRARDMVIGIPALLAWQAQEGGRLLGGGMAHRQAITGRDE